MADAENLAMVPWKYIPPPPPPMARQPLVGQGLVIVKPSRSHTYTPHSAGFFWTSDQTSQETDTHATGGIPTRNPTK